MRIFIFLAILFLINCAGTLKEPAKYNEKEYQYPPMLDNVINNDIC